LHAEIKLFQTRAAAVWRPS